MSRVMLTSEQRSALERDIAVVQRYTGANVRDAWDAVHARTHPGSREQERVARWDDERRRKALAAAVAYEGIAEAYGMLTRDGARGSLNTLWVWWTADRLPESSAARQLGVAPVRDEPVAVEQRVRESFERQGLMGTLGATLEQVAEGCTAIRLPRGEALGQQHGYLHAGALIAVLDTACGYAALSLAPPRSEVLTAELKVNLLAPVTGTAVLARGRVVRAGRTLSVCQGDAYDADDASRHLATMLATMVLVPDR